jgi:hypothetical protein
MKVSSTSIIQIFRVRSRGRHQVINSQLVHLTSRMHWLVKRSLLDFSATVAAIATCVPGLVALDVGYDMGGCK